MEQRLLLADIAAGLVRRNNMPAREAEAFVRQFFECIGENLFHDNIVKVKSLGTFKVVGVEARESVDVNSGKRITIEGHAKVSFTPDPVLRDAINKPFAEFETVVINENTPLEAMEAIPVQPENVPEDSVTEVTSEEVQQPAEVVEQPERPSKVALPVDNPSEVTLPVDNPSEVSFPIDNPSEVVLPVDTPSEVSLPVDSPSEVALPVDYSFEVALPDGQPAVSPSDGSVAVSVAHDSQEETVGEVHTPVPSSDSQAEVLSSDSQAEDLPSDSQSEDDFSSESPVNLPRHHGFWHFAFPVLLAVLFFVVGYGVGYQRPVTLPEWRELFAAKTEQPSASKTEQPSSLNNQESEVPSERQKQGESTQKGSPSTPTRTQPERRQPSEVLAYPQVEGGEYYIVGIKGTEVMKPGKTLLNISIKYYQSKDFVEYICKMNDIKNPDVVPLNKELKIPELKRK